MKGRLLQLLTQRAHPSGIVLCSEETLIDRLGWSSIRLRAELRQLRDATMIEILAPQPFLVLRLKKWSGSKRETAQMAGPVANAYSYSKLLQPKLLKNSYRPDQPAAVDELLQEILATLGETDARAFEKAVQLYSPSVIRTALNRVRRAKAIRKNPTAL